MATITSANAIFTLNVPGVFPTGQVIQGYGPDDMVDSAELTVAETAMGADGILSAGFVFEAFKQTVTLQADSSSFSVFDNWYQGELAITDKLVASATIAIPAIKRLYTMPKGWLVTYAPASTMGKVLRVKKYGIQWERVFVSRTP